MTHPAPAPLARRLGTGDALMVGLGAMIGAGVFAAFTPAAAAAGSGLLFGLAIAAAVAYCNAVSSAQLAAQYPTSGGTYIYGRERLGPSWGFVAGWGFVVGKTASCAAMALTFAAYAVDGAGWVQRLVAVAAVLVLTTVNLLGITRTAALARVLVALTLLALLLLVVVIVWKQDSAGSQPSPWRELSSSSPLGVLQSAGLLFFAFAGYARIATLGEEVRDPGRTIPRAILLALAITAAVYAAVAICLLITLGADGIAATPTPLVEAARAVDAAWLGPVVRAGAVVASLGALLALVAGVGRTSLAMARHGDLPRWLAGVDERHHVPHHAEIAVALVVVALVLTTDLRGAIGFSSFGVLVYYAVANAAAVTQSKEHRRRPRAVSIAGLVACLTLVGTLPTEAVVSGAVVLATGLAGRALVRRRRSR
ncbi:MAG: APC family permease [Propionibacteriales bacterium]|nr:APC family permease [Propionibacteriales bacterium]